MSIFLAPFANDPTNHVRSIIFKILKKKFLRESLRHPIEYLKVSSARIKKNPLEGIHE